MNVKQVGLMAFAAIALIWGLGVNLYLAIHLVCRDCIPPVAQVSYVVHWPLLVSVAVLILALLLRLPRRVVLWLFPGAAFFAIWFGPNWIPRSIPAAQGRQVSAATFNVFGFAADPEQTFAGSGHLVSDVI